MASIQESLSFAFPEDQILDFVKRTYVDETEEDLPAAFDIQSISVTQHKTEAGFVENCLHVSLQRNITED